MSEPRIHQRFAVSETVWCVTPYGAIISGPITDVTVVPTGAVHYIVHGGAEVVAHPCFATEAEVLEYRANEVESELYTLRSRLRNLKEAA